MSDKSTSQTTHPLKVTKLFTEFFKSESAAGIILLLCAIVSMCISNSIWSSEYIQFWHSKFPVVIGSINLNFTIEHWINDGLMAIFFLLVGLEIERELYEGELKNIKNAMLPIAAAIGGMAVPALIHYFLNFGTLTQAGIAIPMATDIAFALGMLALLGRRVPLSLKIFLTALAIIDDLGAIIIITLFYNSGIAIDYLLAALAVIVFLLILNRFKVTHLFPYLFCGIILWYFILQTGIHATISGVILAFLIPFRSTKDDHSPSYKLQHFLHKPVAFIILPIFALANTLLIFSPGWIEELTSYNALGIILGLALGKPIGITIFSILVLRTKLAELPTDLTVKHLFGAGCLAGIGFTMSIFIANLAFNSADLVQLSKMAILAGSTISCLLGLTILSTVCKNRVTD